MNFLGVVLALIIVALHLIGWLLLVLAFIFVAIVIFIVTVEGFKKLLQPRE